MAFSMRDLSVLAYANGFTLWHYKAGKSLQGAVAEPGYFNPAAEMLATGDMMMVSAADGGRLVCLAVEQSWVALAPVA